MKLEGCWRDVVLSKRHRLYGEQLFSHDIDLMATDRGLTAPAARVLSEFAYQEDGSAACVGLFEFKQRGSSTNTAAVGALRSLARAANVHAYLVEYRWRPVWSFWITTLHAPADSKLPLFTGESRSTEKELIDLLYQVRGRHAPTLTYDSEGQLWSSSFDEWFEGWLKEQNEEGAIA